MCSVLGDDLDHLRRLVRIADIGAVDVALPESRHVVVGRMRLHYLDWGGPAGVPVVLLHGGGLNAHTWDAVCLGLRGDHRCLAVDQRGHGDSEWSPECDYDFDAYLKDLDGFIDVLGFERLVLVGQSLGGIAAIRYAARRSSRLAGLVVIDVGPFARRSAGLQRVVEFMLGRGEFDSLEQAVTHAMAFNPRRDPALLRHSLRHQLRTLPDGRWTWKRDGRHLSRQWFDDRVAQLRVVWDEASAIDCPTLILRGADSDALSDAEAAQFADLVKGRWVTVPGAGHNVQGDNPRGLLDALRPFLAEVRTP